jgi:hypothetical protein
VSVSVSTVASGARAAAVRSAIEVLLELAPQFRVDRTGHRALSVLISFGLAVFTFGAGLSMRGRSDFGRDVADSTRGTTGLFMTGRTGSSIDATRFAIFAIVTRLHPVVACTCDCRRDMCPNNGGR